MNNCLNIKNLSFLLLMLWIALPSQAQNKFDHNKVKGVADSIASIHISNISTPGMSIAIAKDGKIVYSQGYGKADLELNVDVTPETVFKIGSITKQFTAALVMRLIESGKISLNDSITKFLPDYPTQGHHITIRHLLNHTSGIKSITNVDERQRKREFRLDLDHDELIELFAKAPFDFAPGEQFKYNNSGYILLGIIIEKVTGMSYADYLERELLQPLGLNNTYYCDHSRIIPNRAEGYNTEKGQLVNADYLSMNLPGAAGAICSTVGDLIKWTQLLHQGKVVSNASLKQMISPTVPKSGDTVGYGYGLLLDELAGNYSIYHSGTVSGFSSALAYFPENDLIITVVMNNQQGERYQVLNEIARAAMGTEIKNLPLSDKSIAQYEGTYVFENRELRVFNENGFLKAQLGERRPFDLFNQGEHVFIPEVGSNMKFVFNIKKGRAEGFNIHEGLWEVTKAKRK